MSDDPLPVVFKTMPREKFPFVVQAFDSRNGALVWQKTIEGPGAIYVPPLKDQIGARVTFRITFADGTVEDTP